jgi:3-(3-hydroxy-phenyl)propionate hydroxylase
MPTNDAKLPVIIAGAGPCGLVAAITLQQQGVPFLVLERASRQQCLCSNVGSGFDLAPTVLDILRNRLKIADLHGDGFKKYGGMYMCGMDGQEVRECSMSDMLVSSGKTVDFLSANRAAMQER